MRIKIVFKDGTAFADAEEGRTLFSVLRGNGAEIASDCGGRGACGKCAVRLLSGSVSGAVPDGNGYVLSCKARVKEPCAVAVNLPMPSSKKGRFAEGGAVPGHAHSLACDLGTTTLAFSLVDTDAGKTVARFTALNGQAAFGADVISRISAASAGNLERLRETAVSQLNVAISLCAERYGAPKIDKTAVAGNTTMLHILLGVSPEGIGTAPYAPVFLSGKTMSGAYAGLNCGILETLPCCSAFVGADIVAGVCACGLKEGEMLIDLGTNGEIIYRDENGYHAASTAAGPCFEGACIECGMGGVEGAISGIEGSRGNFAIRTVGNAEPRGICGAGLVDLVACLLRDGTIDETGSMSVPGGRVTVTDGIYLSAADVRQFQLAKSAIASGIETLLRETGKDAGYVKRYRLAGGVGYHINVGNAVFTGIFPPQADGKTEVAGNSSLAGTEKYLLDGSAAEEAERIAAHCETLDLNSCASFAEAYVNNMTFDNERGGS